MWHSASSLSVWRYNILVSAVTIPCKTLHHRRLPSSWGVDLKIFNISAGVMPLCRRPKESPLIRDDMLICGDTFPQIDLAELGISVSNRDCLSQLGPPGQWCKPDKILLRLFYPIQDKDLT